MSGLTRTAILGALMAMSGGQIFGAGASRSIFQPQTAGVNQDSESATRYRGGPGFTAAHVKRMAKKLRNQQRHKTACRRKGR